MREWREDHSKEHDEFYKIAEISHGQVWMQESLPVIGGAPDLEIFIVGKEGGIIVSMIEQPNKDLMEKFV